MDGLAKFVQSNEERKAQNDQAVDSALLLSYESLQQVVGHIVLVPDGNERLGTKNDQILSGMIRTAELFNALSAQADDHSKLYGELAADSMQDGDQNDNFMTDIKSWAGRLLFTRIIPAIIHVS